MSKSSHPTSAASSHLGRIEEEVRPGLRAKVLPRRLAPCRQAGRTALSEIYGRAVERHENHARVASVLWVSESISRRWADPDESQQIDAADICALFVASKKTLVYGLLHDILAWCDANDVPRGYSDTEHAMSLVVAAGTLLQAARDGDEEKYVSALDDLQQGVREARRDKMGVDVPAKKAGV